MSSMIDRGRVRLSFERASGSYDQVAQLQREMGDRLQSRLDYIRITPALVVDMGAGTGVMSEQLARRFPKAKVVAADFAHGMMLQARQRRRFWNRLPCVCAEAAQLPLADGSVDLLVSNAMLQWSNNPVDEIREWLRVLKPGGLLLFSTFGPQTLLELRQAWAKVDHYEHVSAFMDMHDLGDMLLGGGWDGPVLDVDRFTLQYVEVRQLMQDLKGIGAANAMQGRGRGLTGKGRMQEMVVAYDTFRRDGQLPASYEVIYGLAWAPVPRRLNSSARVSLQTLQAELARRPNGSAV